MVLAVRPAAAAVSFFLLLCLTWPAAAQTGATRDWLDRMSRAFRELNYSGVFTYEFGQEMSSVRIVHAVVDGNERERVVHLDGPLLEVIRDGHHLSCIHVGDSLVRLDHTIPAGPFAKKFGEGIGKLEDHYELVVAGSARVADREAVLIDVRPRDAFRFGYQLALDRQSALLLRSMLVDAQQRILERFQFAEVSIGGEPDLQALQPTSKGHVVAHHLAGEAHADDALAAAMPDWRVAWLPVGFMMAASDLQRGPRQVSSLGSQMYTDGLAVFSIFVDRVSGDETQSGSARRGGTVAYTMPMIGNSEQIVTVVGEVPLTTARRVANSVNIYVVDPR